MAGVPNVDGIIAMGTLIGQQVDLLWSASIAMMVAETYIACRFLESSSARLNRTSYVLLFGSTISHMVSLFFGYLARGATIDMAKDTANGALSDAVDRYPDAALTALCQFGFLMLGILLFVILFVQNRREVGIAIRSASNG